MTLSRMLGLVVALAAVAFAAGYLLTSSGGAQSSRPSGLHEMSFPAPKVALPAAARAVLPALAPPSRRSRPVSPAPAPPAAPPPAVAPPAPAAPHAPAPRRNGGGGIIQG
jgi:hypothetical protein